MYENVVFLYISKKYVEKIKKFIHIIKICRKNLHKRQKNENQIL
jgi:hypothetical protein